MGRREPPFTATGSVVMLFVNNVRENAMIKIVNEEVVNKVTELKALSLGFTACNKLLQMRNYCTRCKETSYGKCL